MLPGKRDFYHAVKRGVAPHTRKQRVPAAISKLRSAYFTGYKKKNCTYYIYVTGYGKTDHFAHNFKIELLVFKGSVDLKQ